MERLKWYLGRLTSNHAVRWLEEVTGLDELAAKEVTLVSTAVYDTAKREGNAPWLLLGVALEIVWIFSPLLVVPIR
ncbi:MAG TPA: hypothetical protein VMW50_07970 [Dehalococcoidia bacterium]|nr:hypothetical protein [Dehalococcoidia bacterium]